MCGICGQPCANAASLKAHNKVPVLRIRIRIRIHRIQMFWASRIRSRTESISQIYGSGSFYHQAKIVRKTLIPTVLWLFYEFSSWKNVVNVSSKSNKQIKVIFLQKRSLTKIAGSGSESGSISQGYGSADPDPHPDPYQNFMDPQHCKVHTHGKPFSCGKCGKDFVKKASFFKHVEACSSPGGHLVASSSRDEKRGWIKLSFQWEPEHGTYSLKVLIYIEHHSVCPLVGIGPPHPSPASECAPPPWNQRGGGTRLRVRGGGVPIPTSGEKA